MIKSISLGKWSSSPFLSGLKTAAGRLGGILSLSLAEDAVAPAAALSVSIEKGGVSLAYATRLFSFYTLKHFKTYNFREGEYPEAEEVASAVSRFLGENGLRSVPLALCIPKAWVITKVAEFPDSVRDNLANAIPYEMDRLTPFSADEVLYDFSVIGAGNGMIRFLLAAANAEKARAYLGALKKDGHTVSRLTSGPLALSTLYKFIDRGRDTAQVILEIAENDVETSVIINGVLRNVAHNTVPQNAAKASAIEDLINFHNSRLKKDGHSPAVIVWFKSADARLKESLRAKGGIRFLDEMNFRIKGLGDKTTLLADALGGAVEALLPGAKSSATLNLLSNGKKESAGKSYLLTIALTVALLGLFAAYSVTPVYQEKALVGAMDKKIGEIKKDATAVEKIRQEIEGVEDKLSLIKDFNRDHVSRLVIMKELTKIIPDDTWLNRIRIAEDGVEIYGYSETATGLIPKLEASKHLMNVEFASPTMRDSRMDMDRFAIKAKIEE